jgi:hypothetical protein
MRQVVVREITARQDGVDEGKPGRRAATHRHRDCAV